jgi:RNA polymerase sigma factor (sigma-70 family)
MTIRENRLVRIAELLGLPVEVIQAYGKPRTRGAFRRVGKLGTVIDTGGPSSRLMTLKGTEPQPAFVGVEEVEPSKTGEDELYAQWCKASEEQKPDLEEKLFKKVLKHARAVMWPKIPDGDENLARHIASVVIEHLAEFRGESKFSTWVHSVILNQCNLYLRKKVKDENRFCAFENPEVDTNLEDDNTPEDNINLRDPRAEAAFDRVEEALDFEPLERLLKELPTKQRFLLDCVLDDMTMAEAAKKLGIKEDAAESSWRRLRGGLRKKMLGKPDGK